MSRINRVPQGLQDLLGSQNFGDNPSELSAVVAPVIDLERFLFAERRNFHYFAPVNTAVDGSFAATVIPTGEIWFVETLSVAVAVSGLGASWTGDASVMANNLTNTNSTINPLIPIAELGHLYPNAATAASSGFTVLSHSFPKMLPFFGGEQIIFHWNNATYSGGQTYTLRAAIQYIKAKV